jgi:hypothetical protein
LTKGEDRKAAIAAYKERKSVAGIYVIRCAASGEAWVGQAPNLDTFRTVPGSRFASATTLATAFRRHGVIMEPSVFRSKYSNDWPTKNRAMSEMRF